jgi:hypothetical protein
MDTNVITPQAPEADAVRRRLDAVVRCAGCFTTVMAKNGYRTALLFLYHWHNRQVICDV